MIHAVLTLGLFSLYFPSALSKVTADSICPVLVPKQDFRPLMFQGRWLVQGTWRNPSNSELECNVLNYAFDKQNGVKITDTGYNPQSKQLVTTLTNARIPETTHAAEWELSSGIEGEWVADYLILDTDYWDYAVVYSCKVHNGERVSHAWILTKQSFPKKSNIDKALESASRFGLNQSDFIRMDRLSGNCYAKLNALA